MKKQILIIHHSMEIGGAESSLLGMLQCIDYEIYSVDLMLFNCNGELLALLPAEVNLINTPKEYQYLALPIKEVLKHGGFQIAVARLIGKFSARWGKKSDLTYITKQYCHRLSLPFLPRLKKEYDMAISYIDPHYIISKKVDSKVKLAWLHTDFSRVDVNRSTDFPMWNGCDFIVNVSDSCKKAFDARYPELAEKSIVIENILSKDFVYSQSQKVIDDDEILNDGSINLLSIGRFCEAKNFDNIPDICRRILDKGINVKWYIIGYGGDEQLIKDKIAEFKMENNVIMLGKKENPYPYIKACDIYVQPSRYEGKCVSVREAQMLHKPVIITNYATSSCQLIDGYDGVIVPMDNEGCADGVARVIRDKELQRKLIENTKSNDYTNMNEIEKLYSIIKES